MDTRRTKNDFQPRGPPHKATKSQPTIDSYIRPVTRARHGQNDIRSYFPPVKSTAAIPGGTYSKSDSPRELPALSETHHGKDAKLSTSRRSPSPESSINSIKSTPESQHPDKRDAGILLRPRKEHYVRSPLVPRYDSLFGDYEFPRSASSMAPREADVVRHSLVPKPLNIKPHPPPAETSPSPSQTTSSPSSAGISDATSLDGEVDGKREAPSFKQTYSRVHSRQNTNDGRLGPLTALPDPPSKNPLRQQRMRRPTHLRSNTAPELLDPSSTDSVVYFLPTISPASDSSAENDERAPLMLGSGYPTPMPKASLGDAKRRVGKFEHGTTAQVGSRSDVLTMGEVAISPGTGYRSFALTRGILGRN